MNTSTPDPSVLWRLIARATPGHYHYDRAIRTYVTDAQRAARIGDSSQMLQWAVRAIAVSLLIDRGQRPAGQLDDWERALRDAHELMDLVPPPPYRFRVPPATAADAEQNRFTDDDRQVLVDRASSLGHQDVATADRLATEHIARRPSQILADTLRKLGLTTADLRPSEHQWALRHICDAYWASYVAAHDDR